MQTSLLLRLPAELRLSIYEYVLVQEKPITITSHCKLGGRSNTYTSLSRTCKQTHLECGQILYAANTFHIKSNDKKDVADLLQQWLTAIGPCNARALRSLVVDVVGPPGKFGNDEFRKTAKTTLHEAGMLERLKMIAHGIEECRITVTLSYLSKILSWKDTSQKYVVELDLRDLRVSAMEAKMELDRLMKGCEDRDEYIKLWWMQFYLGQMS